MEIKRHHWVNTIIGILDSVFILTEVEQFGAIDAVNKMLGKLNIPERGHAFLIPASVAMEAESSYYTINMDNYQNGSQSRTPRVIISGDAVVSLDSWRDMFMNMITTSYPDLLPEEKLLLSSMFNTLLLSLGIPERAATYFPDDVVRAWKQSPESNLGF